MGLEDRGCGLQPDINECHSLEQYPEENCAYLESLSVFDDFGYDKDKQKWEDKLFDADVVTLEKVL